jgi:MFS superfamily sulfate permease-like transporter
MLSTLPHPPVEAKNQWTGRPALSVWRVRWHVVVVWVVLVVVVLVVAVVEGVHLAITVACLDT